MGTNKKLLILSLLIVGSNLVYSASELDKYDGKTQSVNGGKEYENNVEQTINSGKWLHITDGKVTNNETGKIVVTGSGPVAQFAGEKAEFLNKGNIEVQNGKGFYNGNGTLINDGTITVKKGIGVQLKGEKATFKNNKTLNVIGGNGAEIAQGSGNNIGEINVSGGNGIYFNGVEKGKKGEFINQGTINVSGGNGVNFGKVEGEATFTNKDTINVTGGAGANVGKGNFNNDGTINVSGGKGLYITGGKVTNQGNIIINSGTGLQIKNGTKGEVINSGNILIKGGTGIDLAGGNFTNSGIIDAGINGVAIKSSTGTNNTLFLKDGNKIIGTVKGSTGIDVLAVEGGSTYENLAITGYDKIVSLKSENSADDAVISNSNISLGFNQGTDNYINGNKELNGDKTGLTIKNSNLIVDLTNKIEGTSLVDSSEKAELSGDIKVAFSDKDNKKEFNVNEILGDEFNIENVNFQSTARWNYSKDEKGNLIASKKSYAEAVGKSQLSDFGNILEGNTTKEGDFGKSLRILEFLDASQFTDAMTQLSGGVHGYTVDFAAINSRTLSNTIKNRELNKDRLRDKAFNSYDQEVAYINNNHKIGGLMNVDYNEDGVLGINEKQIMPNGKLGLVFGGSKGKAKFENGKNGKADMDNLYLGGYYAYDFTDKLTLVSNANFVYSHTNVTRNVNFGDRAESINYSYESTYPVFGFGGGATLYYTPYDSSNNSVTLYGGIDWTKIVQGNINENSDVKKDETNENLTIKNIPADEQMYDSVVPHIGLSLSNNGYIFNRKYRLGVNVDYETELGNIKNGKKLKLSALNTPHRVETAERENIVSYSLNGALDLTEDFTIYGNYTKADSDEYDAERVEAGFKYKMDRMSDLFVTGPLLGNIENSKPYSRRWTGVASLILESEDDSDRSYYNDIEIDSNQSQSRGDYATSLKLKPKFTLSLRDRDTKWSYYFETYYMSNGMGMDLDKNERRKSESRIHAEARWADQYSKGKYGFNIGYRNETTSAPTLSTYAGRDRLSRGLHQFRFTPNFTYNLGNGFILGGSTTGIIAYDYEGYRKGQTDFELENEYGITYNGLMPRWRFNVNYFREETWYDNDFRKPGRVNTKPGVYEYMDIEGDRRYQSNQLRPRITYFFGNGGRVELSARIPLGNGYWYNSDDNNKKTAEKYETRYGIKYYQPITPGLTGMIGGEILTIKTRTTSSNNYGKETRDYSIRPTIGISYNF
ncbi:autotransporter domain-containing protein [uncultured Fusobacterium sp.]|uniref:autotransporter outer membrane beta-barrel domain-containing protein n=1 Tax=uncultured Fusobacterium sp. TaxID=159267 RepID=UPI0025CE84E1|nr:autotransporter domain-containing protein [uncultured Fusobacterium sp.]